MKSVSFVAAVLTTATLFACSEKTENGPPPPSPCPTARPTDGTPCPSTVTAADQCHYKDSTTCPGLLVEWQCACLRDKWVCAHAGQGCTPLEAGGPDGRKLDGPRPSDGRTLDGPRPSDGRE